MNDHRPGTGREEAGPFADLIDAVAAGLTTARTSLAAQLDPPEVLDPAAALAYAVWAHGDVLRHQADHAAHLERAATDPDYALVYTGTGEVLERLTARSIRNREELCADVAAATGLTADAVRAGVETAVASDPGLPDRIRDQMMAPVLSQLGLREGRPPGPAPSRRGGRRR